MANDYGFNADPYADDDTRTTRERLGLPEYIAGTSPSRYVPTSSRRQIDVNRPTGSASTQTTTTEYTGERPGKFEKPEWDEGDIKKAASQIAAPKVRQLRQAVQQALVKHYENPNVRKMMVRSALQGYGIGLGNIASASTSAARSEYAQKYSFDMQAAMADFNAEWNEYMGTKKVTQTGETTQKYQDFGDEPYTGPAVFSPNLGKSRQYWSRYGYWG